MCWSLPTGYANDMVFIIFNYSLLKDNWVWSSCIAMLICTFTDFGNIVLICTIDNLM